MLSFHLKCQLLFNYFIVQTVRKMRQQTMLKNAKDVELLPKRRADLCDSGCKLQDKMFTKDWVDLRLKKMQTEPILNICLQANTKSFARKNRKIQSMENRKWSGKRLSFWRRQTSCRKHHKKKIVSRYCKKWTVNNLATRLSAFLCQSAYSFGRSNQSDRRTHWRPRKTGDRNL